MVRFVASPLVAIALGLIAAGCVTRPNASANATQSAPGPERSVAPGPGEEVAEGESGSEEEIVEMVARPLPCIEESASERFALASPYTRLFTRPDERSPYVRSFPVDEELDRVSGKGAFHVFGVVGEERGWMVLETRPGHGGLCHLPPNALINFSIRLYARPGELGDVITRRTRVAFADGTWVEVQGGQAVERTGAPRSGKVPLAVADEFGWFDVEVPEADVGTVFTPTEDHLAFPGKLRLVPKVLRERGATLGGRPLELPLAHETFAGFQPSTGSAVETGLLTFNTQCVSYRVAAAAAAVREDASGGGYMTGLLRMFRDFGDTPTFRLAPGAPIYWPDGARAGKVRCEDSIGGERSEHGGRPCFTIDYPYGGPSHERPPGTHRLTLCFDASDLTPT